MMQIRTVATAAGATASLVSAIVFSCAMAAGAAQGDARRIEPGNSIDPDPDALLRAQIISSHVPEIGIGGDPMLGDPAAPVTIVEFIDYECPYCQGFAKDTFPQLKAHYIDTGRVRYVSRDFPLAKHSRARPAAIAAACARDQGRFWEMHHALLAANGAPGEALIAREATELGLDSGKFAACRADPAQAARLDADFAAARVLGVNGTPTFLVGTSAGAIARGRLLQGDEDYAAFEKILAGYLSAPP